MEPSIKPGLDFIVIGAQKCGTTSLFEYLRRHSEIALPAVKEAAFYSHDTTYEGGWELYARKWFPQAVPESKWGVIATHYMFGDLSQRREGSPLSALPPEAVIPARIAYHTPTVKLIAMLRDPVARAFSHYRMEVFRGREKRDFGDVVRTSLCVSEDNEETICGDEYISFSEYARLLRPYFEYFPRQQMLICFTEDLAVNPTSVLRRVLRFIGVSESVESMKLDLSKRHRRASDRKLVAGVELTSSLNWVAGRAGVRWMRRLAPEGLWMRIARELQTLAYLGDVRNRRAPSSAPTIPPAIEEELRKHFERERGELHALLGCSVPWP